MGLVVAGTCDRLNCIVVHKSSISENSWFMLVYAGRMVGNSAPLAAFVPRLNRLTKLEATLRSEGLVNFHVFSDVRAVPIGEFSERSCVFLPFPRYPTLAGFSAF